MLNTIWPIFVLLSFSYAIFSGNLEQLNSSIFQSTSDAIKLSMELLRDNMFMEWNHANCKQNHDYQQINKFIVSCYKGIISRNEKK